MARHPRRQFRNFGAAICRGNTEDDDAALSGDRDDDAGVRDGGCRDVARWARPVTPRWSLRPRVAVADADGTRMIPRRSRGACGRPPARTAISRRRGRRPRHGEAASGAWRPRSEADHAHATGMDLRDEPIAHGPGHDAARLRDEPARMRPVNQVGCYDGIGIGSSVAPEGRRRTGAGLAGWWDRGALVHFPDREYKGVSVV